MTAEALVLDLREKLLGALAACLPPGREVALLDVPTHANVGDNAILLGELAALRALGRRAVTVVATPDFSARELARRVGGRPILLHGGGNLGDLWPAHQRLRERVLAAFPDQPVVQLPQSIAFSDDAGVARAQEAFSGHRALSLLVRDHESAEFARRRLGVEAVLAPDAAFALGPLARPAPPRLDLTILARTDHEAQAGDSELPPGLQTVDWIDTGFDRPVRLARRLAEGCDRAAALAPRLGGPLGMASAECWRLAAARHTRRGVALLATGRAVVTNRLHAHILSLLVGIPHVITDTVSGKLSGFHRAWTADCDIVRTAGSLSEAVEVARDMLA